jgi:hypothetical protein
MKEGQAAIYYMAADSVDAARDAPFVEKLIKKGYEVGPAADFEDDAGPGTLLLCSTVPCAGPAACAAGMWRAG